jgi:methionyl-tRNA formyltransferase
MQISFWGSSDFSLEILKELHTKHREEKLELAFVVSQPPKPSGRKRELKHNLVAEYCLANEIPLLLPNKISELFNEDGLQKYFFPSYTPKSLACDISFVAAYGKILPEKLLNTTKYGFVNFHGSILPKYRGAIPVQLTVLNQDQVGGITIIKMDKGMDTGGIITKYEIPVSQNITSGELMKELAEISAKMIDRNFDLIFNPESWHLEPQDESLATYSYERDFVKENFQVTYNDSVKLAHGKIMAANPDPKAWTLLTLQGKALKVNLIRSYIPEEIVSEPEGFTKNGVLSIHPSADKAKMYLELQGGFLEIKEIQPEGKNTMEARSFINGYVK